MAVTSYKCPSCGAAIHFKPELQKFHCDYCLSEYTQEEINDIYKEKEKQDKDESQDNIEDLNHLASYTCNSCGATVVTDDTTTSTFCYYCHNPVILSDRLSGTFKPNKMIPFSVDKEKAKKIFLDWASKNRYVPKEFYSSSQLEKITGIYLPYWWADSQVEIDYVGEAEKNRVWTQGDREYTETSKFQIVRKGQIDINNIEELAFTKIDNNLLNGIAPYNESQAVDFSMPYLSGFFAEQYDISKEEIGPKIEEKIDRFTNSLINDTISDFSSVKEKTNKTNILSQKMNYTLLPAWILTYLFEGKTYVFAVNGQTGKSFGELPISNKKVISVASIIFAAISIALLIGGKFIW